MRGNEQQQLFSTVQSYLRTMCMKCHELWYDNGLYNGPTDWRRPVMLLCKVEWTHSSNFPFPSIHERSLTLRGPSGFAKHRIH